MPEHLRALAVILVFAGVVFALAKPAACAAGYAPADFDRRRLLWFALTLAAFLAHNFWIYIAVAAALLLHALAHERNKLALFFFVLLAVPPISAEIGGFGVLRHFFSIDYVRLLALAVLLPAFLSLRAQRDAVAFGRLLPDKILLSYLALLFVLQLQHSTFTDALRGGVFYAFIDVFLPYYVASRALTSLPAFRDALMSLVLGALVVATIGVFEFFRRWLLYMPLDEALGAPWGLGTYLARGQTLRAQASTGQPIVLGYVMAVSIGVFLALRTERRTAWRLGLLLLVAGLIAPVSRGPWLGAAAIVLAFVATGPSGGLRTVGLLLLGSGIIAALLAAGAGIVDYLPFLGTIDTGNVTYRQRIVEVSMEVVAQNPLFGSYDFMQLPLMQQLRQGQGIIDIVNTYLGVALESGLAGLGLFCGFFLATAAAIFRGMRNVPDAGHELHLLGRALLATLLGILVTIYTTSSIGVVAVIYWCVAGMGVAYARLVRATHPALAPRIRPFEPPCPAPRS